MARGWESKAVESQQESAASRQTTTRRPVDAAEAARLEERMTLQLARARALADLQRACVPAHRAMLECAIVDLDARLAAFESPPPAR